MIKRLALILLLAMPLWATSTIYTEPWTSTLDGWTFTQVSCGGTCASGLITTGNPADAVNAKVTGRNKTMTGYWTKALTWQAMGVPSGDIVSQVDGQWDDKAVQTAIACTSSTTAGIQIFDSANTTEITASTVEPALNVAADTAAYTTHNPTGAVNVSSSTTAASTVTLRFNLNPASGSNASAACELDGDNFKLTITSAAPAAGGPKRVYISQVTFHLPRGN